MLMIGALNETCADESNTTTQFLEVCREEQEAEALATFNEALSLKKNGDYEKAELKFLVVLQTDLIREGAEKLGSDEKLSENAVLYLKYNVYKHLGEIAESQSKNEKIQKYYLKAALIDDSNVCLWWTIGRTAFSSLNMQLARHAFEKGLLCSPTHFPCVDKLIEVLYIIGDYSACLAMISRAFEYRDSYTKGFAFRDQIFKEEKHFKQDCHHLKCLYQENPRKNEQLYSKIIEDALLIREKKLLLSKEDEVISGKYLKPLQYYSWLHLGETLLSLYKEITDKRTEKSSWLVGKVDVGECFCKEELQGSLPIPPINIIKKKLYSQTSQKENTTLKRKKTNLGSSSQESEPQPKRRSTRVKVSKNKESDVNWVELIASYFPTSVKSIDEKSTQENSEQMDIDDDSQNQNISSVADSSINEESLKKEAVVVSNFLNNNKENSGIIFMLENYLIEVAKEWNVKWMSGLSEIYLSIYELVCKHSFLPNPFSSDENIFYLEKLARVILLTSELQLDEYCLNHSSSTTLSPLKGATAADHSNVFPCFERDVWFVKHVIFLNKNNIKQDTTFVTRFLWMQGHHFLNKRKFKNSTAAFKQCLLSLESIEDRSIHLPNRQNANIINIQNLQEKINFLKQNQPVHEVESMFLKKKYKEIVSMLSQNVLETKSNMDNVRNPDRPQHILFLLKSYYELQQYKECFACVLIAFKECLDEVIWLPQIDELLKVFQKLLSVDDINQFITEQSKEILVENLARMIEQTMDGDSTDWENITTLPWLLLFKLMTMDLKSENEEEIENIVDFIHNAHEYLGRKRWCCEDDGIFLFSVIKQINKFLKAQSFDSNFVESLSDDIEQCLYCLFGNPCKKIKTKFLQDHSVKPITLTWENCKVLYDFYKPEGLPVLDLKTNTISTEVQHVFRKILSVASSSKIEVIPFNALQQYIEGFAQLPNVQSNPEKFANCFGMHDIFYYLGDFYFKNKEFSKALKYYMHDVTIIPTRFQSWAAMAITRGSKLEDKINQYDDKGESILRKHVVSTLRCFEKAVSFNQPKGVLYEEYGQTAYTLHSFISRKQLQEKTIGYKGSPQKEPFPVKQKEMLLLSRDCFKKALELASSKGVDEWLHLYMLGKCAERLNEKPNVFFHYYQECLKELHENGAVLLKKISYHSAPHHAIESIEIFYRLYTCILKLLPQLEVHQYDLLQEELNRIERQDLFLKSQSLDVEFDETPLPKGTLNTPLSKALTNQSSEMLGSSSEIDFRSSVNSPHINTKMKMVELSTVPPSQALHSHVSESKSPSKSPNLETNSRNKTLTREVVCKISSNDERNKLSFGSLLTSTKNPSNIQSNNINSIRENLDATCISVLEEMIKQIEDAVEKPKENVDSTCISVLEQILEQVDDSISDSISKSLNIDELLSKPKENCVSIIMDKHKPMEDLYGTCVQICDEMINHVVNCIGDTTVCSVGDATVNVVRHNTMISVTGNTIASVTDDNAITSVTDNTITSVTDDTIASVTDDNTITSVTDETITSVTDNTITSVTDNTITSVTDNTMISVTDNTITSVTDDTITSVTDNTITSLTDNTITSVTDNTITSVTDDTITSVTDNDTIKDDTVNVANICMSVVEDMIKQIQESVGNPSVINELSNKQVKKLTCELTSPNPIMTSTEGSSAVPTSQKTIVLTRHIDSHILNNGQVGEREIERTEHFEKNTFITREEKHSSTLNKNIDDDNVPLNFVDSKSVEDCMRHSSTSRTSSLSLLKDPTRPIANSAAMSLSKSVTEASTTDNISKENPSSESLVKQNNIDSCNSIDLYHVDVGKPFVKEHQDEPLNKTNEISSIKCPHIPIDSIVKSISDNQLENESTLSLHTNLNLDDDDLFLVKSIVKNLVDAVCDAENMTSKKHANDIDIDVIRRKRRLVENNPQESKHQRLENIVTVKENYHTHETGNSTMNNMKSLLTDHIHDGESSFTKDVKTVLTDIVELIISRERDLSKSNKLDPTQQYKMIANRCLQGLGFCLRRFGEHYKSQYMMARFLAYDPHMKNLEWSRDLLIGGCGEEKKHAVPLPAHGLFSLKKKTNMFQYLWRIPVAEVDRPGSFFSHLHKAVNLLLHVLKELKDYKLLCHVSTFLHKTPDKDRKYLRDSNRLYFSSKALTNAIDIVNLICEEDNLMDVSVLDVYEIYKHAQKLQIDVLTCEKLLVKLYKHLPKEEIVCGDVISDLDAAVKYCTKSNRN